MIELVVALVAILTILSGLLLIVSVGTAEITTMMEARREAGANAMSATAPITSPNFIKDWDPNHDSKKMTADDTPILGNAQPFDDNIVNHLADNNNEWTLFSEIKNNKINQLKNNPIPVASFGLVKGEEHISIPLLPVIQKLIFNSDKLEIDTEVWLTHTKGIY